MLLTMRDDVAYLQKVSSGGHIEIEMSKLSTADRVWIRRIVAEDRKRKP
jgi:hypothetical protein